MVNDVVVLVGSLAERAAQGRDLSSKIVFVDDRVRPDEPEEFVLLDGLVLVLQQDGEHLEGLGRNRNGVAVGPQRPLDGVNDEGAEG